MKRLLLVILILIAAMGSIPASANQVLQTLSGLVLSVDVKSNQLHVNFEHPVTGENLLKIFTIDQSTGFKHVKGLGQIKPEDPVNIDYEEKTPDQLKAVYIEVVRLNDVPFTKEQVDKIFH